MATINEIQSREMLLNQTINDNLNRLIRSGEAEKLTITSQVALSGFEQITRNSVNLPQNIMVAVQLSNSAKRDLY